jgi:hypothetical protein
VNTQRPLSVTFAAILLALFSLANLIPAGPEGGPALVIYTSVVLSILGMAGAVGLWMLKRWGLWLAVVVCWLNILTAAPGLAFAPNLTLRLLASLGVVIYTFIFALTVLPNSRHAYS